MTRFFGRIDHDFLRTFPHHRKILWTWQISVSLFLRDTPPNPIHSTARDDLQMKRFALFLLAWPSDIFRSWHIVDIVTFAWRKRMLQMFLSHTLRGTVGTVPRILMLRWSPSSRHLWRILRYSKCLFPFEEAETAHFFRPRILVGDA